MSPKFCLHWEKSWFCPSSSYNQNVFVYVVWWVLVSSSFMFSAFDNICRMSEHNGVLPCALQDMIETVGDQCQLKTKNWFLQRKGYNRESQPAFNVLDALLKDSLERLKAMRLDFWSWIMWSGSMENCRLNCSFPLN